ncbi:MAG: FecR family protein [Gammaproteobacteria bacterium]|nr:FecR family protein [Gammaproteobacteria bacterium]
MNMFLARQKGFFSFVSIVFLICIALLPINAHAVVGKAEFVLGKVQLVTINGQTILLKRGMGVNVGDKVVTKEKGQVMLRMIDKSKISVRPNSKFAIKNYSYEKNSKNDTAQYELLAGTFRAITGAIGKANKKAFELKTPVGTLGIRGTDFVARYDSDGFYVDVNTGGVSIKNGNGSIDVNPGEFGYIDGNGGTPEFAEQLPAGMRIVARGRGKAVTQEEEMSAIAIMGSEGNSRAAIDSLVRAGLPSQAIVVGGEAVGMDATEVIEQLLEVSPNSTQLMKQLIKDMPSQMGNILAMGIAKNKIDVNQAASIIKSSGGDAKVLESAIALGNLMAPSEKDKKEIREQRKKEAESIKEKSESSVGGAIKSKIETVPVEETTTDPQLIPGSGTGGGEDASPS